MKLAALIGPKDVLLTGAVKLETQDTRYRGYIEQNVIGARNSLIACGAGYWLAWHWHRTQKLIKPLPDVSSISSCMMLDLSNKRYGERGTMFFVNGQPAGLPLQEAGFFPAVMRTWLGNRPVTQDLKDALLDYKAPPVLDALQ